MARGVHLNSRYRKRDRPAGNMWHYP